MENCMRFTIVVTKQMNKLLLLKRNYIIIMFSLYKVHA